MANQVRLWEVGSDQQPTEIPNDAISLESRLEDWLENDISMLEPDLLVIGRQVRADSVGVIDLLCLDSAGDVVVIELKRDQARRDVTAQVLDYASWAQNLTYKRIQDIANEYFDEDPSTLEERFQERFGGEALPDTLNNGHRSIIVAESMDESTERIVEYLSNIGVPINVATVQHFTAADGKELLAQVFLVEPEVAAARGQASHRQRALSVGAMKGLAEDNGIGELYQLFRDRVTKRMSAGPWGLNGCVFQINVDGSLRSAIRLNLAGSNSENGMQFELRSSRLAEHFDISQEKLKNILPTSVEISEQNWSHKGCFRTTDEIDKFIAGLQEPLTPSTTLPQESTD